MLRGRAAGSALGEGRYLECRYEDLVADPEAHLRRVCEFLELRFDDAMLRYHERDPMAVAGVGGRYYHEHANEPPMQGLRDWRTQMSRSDVLLFESIAGQDLEAFGYERATIVASRTERARVGLRTAAAGGRKRLKALRRLRGTVARKVRHV